MKKVSRIGTMFVALLALASVALCAKGVVKKGTSGGSLGGQGVKSVLFKTFGGCGVQIWQDEWNDHALTFNIDYGEGIITVGNVGWWGGAFGAYENGVASGAHFDLSKVATVTFDAKASTYGTIYFNIDNNNKNECDLTTEYEDFEIPVSKAKSKTEVLFTIGGVSDLNDPGTKIYIKNIAFYDAKGNEIVPQYK